MRKSYTRFIRFVRLSLKEFNVAFMLLFPWQTMINLSFNCFFHSLHLLLLLLLLFLRSSSFVRICDSSINFTVNLMRAHIYSHYNTIHIHLMWKQLIYTEGISFYAFQIANNFKKPSLNIWYIIHFVSSLSKHWTNVHHTTERHRRKKTTPSMLFLYAV